jgi:hypothetical protein
MKKLFRARGDTTYHLLTPERYRGIKARFIKNGARRCWSEGVYTF